MTQQPFVVSLDALRQQTRAFIDVFPLDVVLVRPAARVKAPTGGWVQGTETTTLAPQRMTLLENFNSGATNAEPTRALDSGQYRETDFVLLGMHDADMEVGDTFTLKDQPGRLFRIIETAHNNGWERRGYVAREGKES